MTDLFCKLHSLGTSCTFRIYFCTSSNFQNNDRILISKYGLCRERSLVCLITWSPSAVPQPVFADVFADVFAEGINGGDYRIDKRATLPSRPISVLGIFVSFNGPPGFGNVEVPNERTVSK